jgi:hypothetical protein
VGILSDTILADYAKGHAFLSLLMPEQLNGDIF